MKEWEESTLIIIKLARITDENHREEVIQTINHHLERREQLLSEIKAPFTDEEQSEKKRFVQLEREMTEVLEQFYQKLKEELFTMKAKKGTVKNYVNPYDKVARDGTYYDTKQ